ncbi:MFS transporter [Allokutzneria multivorans]|uniref:MFS transporter n=1 Tax=Allokutzneria multivorans TaxID=1142134 RepID=A0ABP7SIM2_9PSEU
MTNALGAQYWKLWTSSGLSNLADGVAKVALPLVAVQFTRSPVLVAGLAFAVTVPWLLFALPAGALADRLDRRRAMIGANVVRTLALGVLTVALLTGFGSIWALYAVALCIGTAETIYDTSAQSIIPQMVPREGISRANSKLYAVELTANEFAGPPLAGFLVAAGAAFAFGAPVALWALAVAALLLVRGSYRIEREHRTTLRADIAEGLKFLAHHRVLRTLAAMVGMSNFATNAAFSVFVLHAVGPTSALGLSEQSFGLLMTGVAAGSLVGSFVAERIEKLFGRSRTLALTVLGTAGVVGVPGLTTNPFVIAGVFFVGGVGLMTWNLITVSLRQRIVPGRLLGRVNSGYRLLAWGSMPLGAVTGGLIAQLLGVNAVFLVMAPLMLVQLLGMRVLTEANLAAAED